MSVNVASKCLDMAAFCGVDTALLIGGEPLMHPDLGRIVDYAHERGMRVVLVSNGLALHDRLFADEILGRLLEADELGISIKGFNDRQYLANCSERNGFTMLRGALSNIAMAGVNYSLSYVVSESCLDTLVEDVSSFCDEFQKPITLSFCSPYIPDCGVGTCTTPDEHADLISRTLLMLASSKQTGIAVHINAPLCLVDQDGIDSAFSSMSLITGCHALNRSGIVFDTNGDLLLCNHLMHLPVGIMNSNYSNPAEFARFLSSNEFDEVWRCFTRLPYEKCDECDNLALCGGACPLLYL